MYLDIIPQRLLVKFNRIYIELTNICGLKCSFCPTKSNSDIMNIDFFENIVSQAKEFTSEIACHVMGDPLVLSNIVEYLDIIQKYNMKSMITTSGFYNKNHSSSVLFHQSIRQFNISLNSFNKNSTTMSLQEYLKPIFNMCKEKLIAHNEPFLNLRLWNMDESESENDFNDTVISEMENFFDIKIIKPLDKKGFRLASKIILHFDDYFQWPSLANQVYGDGHCKGLDSHIAVLYDGRVVPCCLDYDGIMELGNLNVQTLDKIITNKRSCAISNGFADNKAIEELCQKCSYKERFKK